jgi:hypothetical protein
VLRSLSVECSHERSEFVRSQVVGQSRQSPACSRRNRRKQGFHRVRMLHGPKP